MIPDDSAPLDATLIRLDHEISDIQAQISSLKAQRSLQVTNILSSRTSQSILNRLRASDTSSKTKTLSAPPAESDPLEATLLLNATKQVARNQECLYRYGAGITSFKVHDPDPNAVDNGNILGLRIDVGSTGKFIRPYYIMLNKPYPSSNLLRIHRHTVPPCIPLSALAARYLPAPMISGFEVVKAKKQDLSRFARSLRNEVVAYHNRMTSIKRLRKEFKLDEKLSSKGKERERVIVDICAADAEIKQVKIDWVDGRVGRCLVDDKGKLLKCVIFGEDGRDRETERRIMGGDQRMEGIGERLMEGIY